MEQKFSSSEVCKINVHSYNFLPRFDNLRCRPFKKRACKCGSLHHRRTWSLCTSWTSASPECRAEPFPKNQTMCPGISSSLTKPSSKRFTGRTLKQSSWGQSQGWTTKTPTPPQRMNSPTHFWGKLMLIPVTKFGILILSPVGFYFTCWTLLSKSHSVARYLKLLRSSSSKDYRKAPMERRQQQHTEFVNDVFIGTRKRHHALPCQPKKK